MADNILLLPQRRLKKILQDSASFEALASASIKEADDSISIIPDVPKHNRKKRIRPPSLFETTFIISDKKIYVIKLCESLDTNDFINISQLNKRSYGKMTSLFLHMNIKLNIFLRFSIQYSMKNSNGILDGNSLNVGRDGEIIDQDNLVVMTNFFHNFKGGLILRTLALSIKKECSMPKIKLFFSSLNSIIGRTILYLSFEGSALGIDGITVFCDVLKLNQLKQIKKLNINRCNVTELGVKKIRLTTVQYCPNLEEICISSNSAPSSTLEFFQSAYFLKAKPLVRIEARDNGLDLQSTLIAPIVSSGTLSVYHLRKLDLSANPLTDSGFLLLMKTIWPLIDSEGREVVNETYELIELILDYTEIGNEISFGSLKYLLNKLPKVPQLTSLCLASNPLGNEGVMIFVNTALCRNLIHLISLDIGDCGAGSESLNHLARAIGFSPDKHAIKILRIYGDSPELQNCIINSQLSKEYLKIVKLM